MEIGQKHSIKKYLIQFGAIAMTLCYLFAPFKNELVSVLHTVSHHLKMPDNLISHSSTASDFYWESSASTSKTAHDHTILAVLGDFLNGTESNDDAPISKELKIKIDKHISEYSYNINNNWSLPRAISFPPIFNTKPLGYIGDINPPPDLSLSA